MDKGNNFKFLQDLAASILQNHFGIHIKQMEGGGGIRGIGRRNAENEDDIGQNVADLRCGCEESVEIVGLSSVASTSRNVTTNATNRNRNSSDERKSIMVRIKRMDEKKYS